MKKKWLIGMAITLAIAAFVSPFASSSPDGLEKVAKDKGFLHQATSTISSPIAGYLFPGIKNQGVATSVAGVMGTVLTFGVMFGFGKLIVKRNQRIADKQEE